MVHQFGNCPLAVVESTDPTAVVCLAVEERPSNHVWGLLGYQKLQWPILEDLLHHPERTAVDQKQWSVFLGRWHWFWQVVRRTNHRNSRLG